jgi:hypothetical protein
MLALQVMHAMLHKRSPHPCLLENPSEIDSTSRTMLRSQWHGGDRFVNLLPRSVTRRLTVIVT